MAPVKLGLLTPAASRLGGGVSSAVCLLANSLKATGEVEPIVFSTDDQFLDEDRHLFNEIEIVARPQYGPRSFRFSPSLGRAIQSRDIDVLHLHGIWTHTSAIGVSWARRTGKPYIVSPHGMLEPWIVSRGRMKKWLARIVYETRSLVRANVTHALTEAERSDISAFAPRASIRVIANGITVDRATRTRPRNQQRPFLLYLGRLHPKKNLESLLEAWTRAGSAARAAGYRLVIAGYGEDQYVDALTRKIEEANKSAPVEFVGPAYGTKKSGLLSEANYLVLPSFSEGLPMVVLEAWSHGTPSIMTEACNLPLGFERRAAVRTGVTPEEIELVLSSVFSDDSNWAERSRQAADLVVEEYSADSIARRWVDLYRELVVTPIKTN
jgi:poly(glycerol-phosphate) alpha-glucosyltransferase